MDTIITVLHFLTSSLRRPKRQSSQKADSVNCVRESEASYGRVVNC